MIYSATITTDAATNFEDAKKTVLKVTKGLIYRAEFEFPPGCSGLAYVQVFDGAYQLYPTSPGEAFHSDNNSIGFDDLFYKVSEPFEFIIKTWNLCETWEHTIQVRLGLVSGEAYMSRYIPLLQVEAFESVMAQAAADQDELRQQQLSELASMVNP